MSEEQDELLIKGGEHVWDVALAFLGALALAGGGAYLYKESPGSGIALFALAGFLLLLGIGVAFVRFRSRVWVRPTQTGFVLRDTSGEVEYKDEDVQCMSLHYKKIFSGGVQTSNLRKFVVWVDDEGSNRRITMTNSIRMEHADPLGPIIHRIHQSLLSAANLALRTGQSVEGEGWQLTNSELDVTARKNQITIPLPEISAIDEFDGNVCIWQRGEDLPVCRFPILAANSHMLIDLIRARIPENADQVSGKKNLGRILFERKSGFLIWFLRCFFWLLTVLFGAAGAAILLIEGKIHGLIMLLVAIPFGLIGFLLRTSVLRCHTHGLYHKPSFGKARQLRYEDVETFQFGSTRMYHNGIYTGTMTVMTLTPSVDSGEKKIRYQRHVYNDDTELQELCDHISKVIAGRMLNDIARGETVEWTKHARFTPKGLEYQAAGFLSRKPPVMYPYAKIDRWEMNTGNFKLWVKGKKSSILSMQTAANNFFPGFYFIQSILAGVDPNAPPEPIEDIDQLEEPEEYD